MDAVTLFRSHVRAECVERALVLQAIGIEHEILREAAEYELVVDARDVPRASEELRRYASENTDWPPAQPEPVRLLSNGQAGVVGYIAVLLIVAYLQTRHYFDLDWLAAGKVDAGLIREGEWWRTITALTLHLDLGHLAANIAFGTLFGLFVGQFLGNGLAWASILIAGATGNALNALIQPINHTAAGASTAVFAALGILGAYVWQRRRALRERWAHRWAPVVAAVALLAYTGTGGERTDIVAHLTGFIAGGVLGAVYGSFGDRIRIGDQAQLALGFGALMLLVFGWKVALNEYLA